MLARLDDQLQQAGVRGSQKLTNSEQRFAIDQHVVMVYVFLLVVSGILAVVGTIGLITTIGLNVTERRREMAVLRAIGATPGKVALIVVIEGVTLAVVAFVFATLLAPPLGESVGELILGMMFQSAVDIETAYDPIGIAIWFLLSFAGESSACLLPAWQSSRQSVTEALAYE